MSYSPEFDDALEKLESLAEDYGDHKPLWDILVGLRGPDDPNNGYPSSSIDDKSRNRLSQLTNHRIRGVVGLYPPRADNETEDHFREQPLTLAEQKERDRLLGKCSDHYADHYWAAVDGIKKLYSYDLQFEEEATDEGDDEPAPYKQQQKEKKLNNFGYYRPTTGDRGAK